MEDLGSPQSFRFAIDGLMQELVDRLHTVIVDLTIILYDCFTLSERQEIDAKPTNVNKVMQFFEVLKTKRTDTHNRFLDAIRSLNYGDLASKITAKEMEFQEGAGPHIASSKLQLFVTRFLHVYKYKRRL